MRTYKKIYIHTCIHTYINTYTPGELRHWQLQQQSPRRPAKHRGTLAPKCRGPEPHRDLGLQVFIHTHAYIRMQVFIHTHAVIHTYACIHTRKSSHLKAADLSTSEMLVYMHTYMHAYMHTHMHAYIHAEHVADIKACACTYPHTYMYTHIHVHRVHCLSTKICFCCDWRAYVYVYVYTYIHTYIHTYIYTYIQMQLILKVNIHVHA